MEIKLLAALCFVRGFSIRTDTVAKLMQGSCIRRKKLGHHALQWSTPGDGFSSLFFGQLRCRPPTQTKGSRGVDRRDQMMPGALSEYEPHDLPNSILRHGRCMSVKHGSWLAGCESSCHGSKRYALCLMLDRRRVALER